MTDASISALAQRRATATNKDYQQKRALLLKHAAELFHLQGVSDTTLADIARAAGLDRATAYYYFANKEEVFAEVLGTVLAERADSDEQIRDLHLPADQALRQLIVSLMTNFDRHYPYLYVYVQQDIERMSLDPDVKAWIVRHSERSVRVWNQVVADGVESGLFQTNLPVGIVAFTLLGAVAWSHRWYKPNHRIGPDAIGEGLADLLIDGLRSQKGRSPTTEPRSTSRRAKTG